MESPWCEAGCSQGGEYAAQRSGKGEKFGPRPGFVTPTMVAAAVPTPSQFLHSATRSTTHSHLFPLLSIPGFSVIVTSTRNKRSNGYISGYCSGNNIRCAAVGAAAETEMRKSYELQALTSWLLKQEQVGNIDAKLTIVLSSISMACKQIAALVQSAGISNFTGVQGAVNVQGEDQKKLYVVSNEVFSNCLRSSGRTGIIASEEEDAPVAVEESYSGNYIAVFDPLDGSSNIDTAVSTGSIFGIYSC